MSNQAAVTFDDTHHVRDSCLCLHTQRAARALARRFDEAFRPFGLTSGQFSILHALNRTAPPPLGTVAAFLAMDRTTLTAALKPLERQRLVEVQASPEDRRLRLLKLTPAGRAVLARAMPVWHAEHARLDAELPAANRLRRELALLAR